MKAGETEGTGGASALPRAHRRQSYVRLSPSEDEPVVASTIVAGTETCRGARRWRLPVFASACSGIILAEYAK